MNRIPRTLLSVLVMLLASCGTNINKWGEAKVYDDFLWKKCEPDTLKQTVVIELNNDAAKYGFQRMPRFGFYAKNEQGERVAIKEADFFVNGRKIGGNTFALPYERGKSEFKLEVGVVFKDEAMADDYVWYLDVADAGDLDRINDEPVSSTRLTSQREPHTWGLEAFKITKNHIMNPLLVTLLLSVVMVVVGVFVARIVCRASHPKFKQSSIVLVIPGVGQNTVHLRGRYMVVLTNQYKTQSAVKKFFNGTIAYVVNPAWTSDVIFKPNGHQGVMILFDNPKEYYCDGRMLKKGMTYKLQRVGTQSLTQIIVN